MARRTSSYRIIDCFMYAGETDAVSIRFDEQKNDIDEYWVIESNKTFTGLSRSLRFHDDAVVNGWDLSKVKYFDISDRIVVTDNPWQVERASRNFVSECLNDLDTEDKLIVSDADEIVSKNSLSRIRSMRIKLPIGLQLQLSYLYLNYRLLKPIWVANSTSAVVLTKSLLIHKTADDWRRQIQTDTVPHIKVSGAGWHASFLGGIQSIRTKMSSYSHTEFGIETVPIDLDINKLVQQGRDLLGRDGFAFGLVTKEDLPACIQMQSDKYGHLLLDVHQVFSREQMTPD